MSRKFGLCSECATKRLGERRKSIALKEHGVPGGLPCSGCGVMVKSREYDPRKEPSPYARVQRRKRETVDEPVRLYLDELDHPIEEGEDDA